MRKLEVAKYKRVKMDPFVHHPHAPLNPEKTVKSRQQAVNANNRDFTMTQWSHFLRDVKKAYGPQMAVQLHTYMQKKPGQNKTLQVVEQLVPQLKTFQSLKERVHRDGDLDEKEFSDALAEFFKTSNYAKKHKEPWLIFQEEPFGEFEKHLQKQIILKKLNSLGTEHGLMLETMVMTHLAQQEPLVISGMKSYKDSVFFNLTFPEQIEQLIPYIAKKTGMDEEVLHHQLLDSSLSKENFDNRMEAIVNMSKWNALLGKGELARQFILHMGDPYFNGPIKEQYKKEMLKIYKSAAELSKKNIYPPNIIAKGYKALLDELTAEHRQNPRQGVKHGSDISKVKDRVQRCIFETWVKQEAMQHCRLQGKAYNDEVQAFVAFLLARYVTADHLPKASSIDYLKGCIDLAVEIFLNNDLPPAAIIRAMEGEGKNRTLFKLEEIDKKSLLFTEDRKNAILTRVEGEKKVASSQ